MVIADCTAALRIDPDYAKCLLRRAQVSKPDAKRKQIERAGID